MLYKTRKHRPPVAVARPLLSSGHSLSACRTWLIAASLAVGLTAQPSLAMDEQPTSNPYLVQIHAHTPDELQDVLTRAQAWSDQFETYPEEPIAIVLHGPEANVFVKQNYTMYKSLVDLAAKLDAFNVVDVKICERWMGSNNIEKGQLPPFVETVPYGPAEEQRLIKAGYQEF